MRFTCMYFIRLKKYFVILHIRWRHKFRIQTLFHSNLLSIIIKFEWKSQKLFSYKFFIYFFWCAKTAAQTCIQLKVDIKQKKENRFYKKFVTYLARVSVSYLAAPNLKPRPSSFGLSYVLAKSNINFDLARIFWPMTSKLSWNLLKKARCRNFHRKPVRK